MMCWRKSCLGWFTVPLLALLAGCGGGARVVEVAGVLTYKGKPVNNAYVDFMPDEGRPSVGQTDDEGRFKLDFDPQRAGALVGKHKVSVRRRPTTLAEREASMLGKTLPLDKHMAEFFDKYNVTRSTVEVVIGGSTRALKLDWD